MLILGIAFGLFWILLVIVVKLAIFGVFSTNICKFKRLCQ